MKAGTKLGPRPPPYSPEQDEKIAIATFDQLPLLAEQFGRTLTSIKAHRIYLRDKRTYQASIVEPPKLKLPQRFARPAWFKEDLSQLSKVR